MIRQIRALEKVSNRDITAATAFDPAECLNQGYFNEMSITEVTSKRRGEEGEERKGRREKKRAEFKFNYTVEGEVSLDEHPGARTAEREEE